MDDGWRRVSDDTLSIHLAEEVAVSLTELGPGFLRDYPARELGTEICLLLGGMWTTGDTLLSITNLVASLLGDWSSQEMLSLSLTMCSTLLRCPRCRFATTQRISTPISRG